MRGVGRRHHRLLAAPVSDGLRPAAAWEQVTALTATLVGLARYAVDVTGSGALTGTVARGSRQAQAAI